MAKKVLVAFCILVALIGGVGFLLPSRFSVERSVLVSADKKSIFPYLNNLKKWQEWSAWTPARYPQMKVSYSGPEEGVGAESSWSDPENGDGRMTITASDPNAGVHFDLFFAGYPPNPGALVLEDVPEGVRVTMRLEGELGLNPVARYVGLFMDRFMGPDFEAGLAKLKKVAEGA